MDPVFTQKRTTKVDNQDQDGGPLFLFSHYRKELCVESFLGSTSGIKRDSSKKRSTSLTRRILTRDIKP